MKISVAMCTWNGEKYIEEQLRSILSQTVPVDELVICDDQSTDNTISIIRLFQQQYPGIIRLEINTERLNARKNFEKSIGLCTGDLIFLCDQDDQWVDIKVAVTIAFFKNTPSALGMFTNGNILGDDGIVSGRSVWGSISFSTTLQQEATAANLLEMLLKLNNFVTGAALCIRKEARTMIIPFFCPAPLYWHDYWIALQLAQRNQLYHVNEKLINYRVHSAQQIGFSDKRPDNDEAAFKEAIWYLKSEELPLQSSVPYLANAIKRCITFLPHLQSQETNPGRVQAVIRELESAFAARKKTYINRMPFIEKKKLLIKSWQRPDKYHYLNFKDKLKLFFLF